jgi:hypothetical protein
MTRAQQVMQWQQIDRPLAAAIGRRHYNERRAREQVIRQDTLRALLRRLGRKGALRLGQVRYLARAFGVSRRTIHQDLTAILGMHYSARWRQGQGGGTHEYVGARQVG